MRILGYIDDPILKITVFKDNGKILVQAQDGDSQLTYRFRDGGVVDDLPSVQKLFNSDALEMVRDQINQLKAQRLAIIKQAIQRAEDQFDDII